MKLHCCVDINTGRPYRFADLGQNLSYVVRKRDHIVLYTQWSMDNDFEVAWSDNEKNELHYLDFDLDHLRDRKKNASA